MTPSPSSSEMSSCKVVAAVIAGSAPGEVWAFRRAPLESHAGRWEFPGGKIRPDETPQAALVRELQEELAVDVEVGEMLWVGQEEGLEISFYKVRVLSGSFQMTVHDAHKSVLPNRSYGLPWSRLDRQFVERLARDSGA